MGPKCTVTQPLLIQVFVLRRRIIRNSSERPGGCPMLDGTRANHIPSGQQPAQQQTCPLPAAPAGQLMNCSSRCGPAAERWALYWAPWPPCGAAL